MDDDDLRKKRLILVRQLAGEHFDSLLASREAVFTFANHPDANVRAAALVCGNGIWECGRSSDYHAVCCRLAAHDTGVPQHIAMNHLGLNFANTKDRSVQKVFIEIIKNANMPNDTRNIAYRELRRVEYGSSDGLVFDTFRDAAAQLNDNPVVLQPIEWNMIRQIEDEIADGG